MYDPLLPLLLFVVRLVAALCAAVSVGWWVGVTFLLPAARAINVVLTKLFDVSLRLYYFIYDY